MAKLKIYGARRHKVPATPDSYDTSNMRDCPECGGKAVGRECVPGGWINCAQGHRYSPEPFIQGVRRGLQFSQAVRDAMASEVQRIVTMQGMQTLAIYDGTPLPASCRDICTGHLLAMIRRTSVNVFYQFHGPVMRTGEPTYWRVYDGEGNCMIQSEIADLSGIPSTLAMGMTIDVTLRINA